MSTYLVALTSPSGEAWESLQKNWSGRCYILSDYIAFVAPNESERVIVTEDICTAVGMSDEGGKVNGVVAEIAFATINGFASKSLWEWLEKVSS